MLISPTSPSRACPACLRVPHGSTSGTELPLRRIIRGMDAKHMLERVATLKQEMQNLHVANARLDEPRWKKGSYEARLSRLEEIKAELAEMLYEFKRTGTD